VSKITNSTVEYLKNLGEKIKLCVLSISSSVLYKFYPVLRIWIHEDPDHFLIFPDLNHSSQKWTWIQIRPVTVDLPV
jgi:hypothetical protein